MKSKLKIFLLLSVAFYFGIELLNPFKEEVVDLKGFTDYYEETNEENGGVSVLADSFYTFEKEYNFPNEYKSIEEIKGAEDGKSETTEVVEEKAPVQEVVVEKKIPEKREYLVKEGDTISEIASLNGMTMDMLLANNPDISVKNLKIGQKLTVVSENGIFYKVEKGDSLYKIASKFKVKVDDILAYNEVEEKSLKIGQSIFLKNPDLKALNRTSGKKGGGSKSSTIVASAGFRYPVEYRGVNSPYGSRFILF